VDPEGAEWFTDKNAELGYNLAPLAELAEALR